MTISEARHALTLERHARWRLKHADEIKIRRKELRNQNHERVLKQEAIYRKNNIERIRVQKSRYMKKNRDFYRRRTKEGINNLESWYVRLKLSADTCVKPSEWPDSIVELKRAQLKLKRICQLTHQQT